MRLLLKLKSNQEQVYDQEYHHKLRGVWWEKLKDSKFAAMHDDPQEVPFSYSNPYPVKNMKTDDVSHVLIASPHDGLINTIAENTHEGEDFEFGELSFSVERLTQFAKDVGEPGSRGVLTTSTGVYIPIWENEWDEYDLHPEYNTDTIAWTPEHSTGILFDKMAQNISFKQDILYGSYLDSPRGDELFDGLKHNKTYSVSIPVSSAGYEYTFVVNKFDFEYTIRDDDHRRWLNLLLDTGLGWRNTLGFGFINKKEGDGYD